MATAKKKTKNTKRKDKKVRVSQGQKVPRQTDLLSNALKKIGAGKHLRNYLTQLSDVSGDATSTWQILCNNLALAILHATLVRLKADHCGSGLSLLKFKPLFLGLSLPARPGTSLVSIPRNVSFENSLHFRKPIFETYLTPDASACNLSLVTLMEDNGGGKDDCIFEELSHFRLKMKGSRCNDPKFVGFCVNGGFSVSLQHAIYDIAPLFAEYWFKMDDTSTSNSSRFKVGTSVFILTHFVEYDTSIIQLDTPKPSELRLGLLEVRLLRGKCLNERQARVLCTMRGLDTDIPTGSLLCMGNVSWERPSA